MTERRHSPSGRLFWLALLAGWAVMGYGLAGVLRNADRTHPEDFAVWFLGSALAHDLLVAPVVFVGALILTRVIPARVRPPIQKGLVVAAIVGVVAFPLVGGFGGPAGNPSALPGDYRAGLLTIWAAIAAVTVGAAVLRWRRTRAGRSATR